MENEAWDYCGSSVTGIGSLNFPVLKQLTREYKCAVFLQNWIDKTSEDQHVVILYSLYLPYLKAIQRIRKSNSALRVVIIVPDLPGEYGILPHNPIKAQVSLWLGHKALKLAESLDGYVVLTEQMVHPLRIANKPYVVVEGIYNQKQVDIPGKSDNSEKRGILYAGTLHRQFGIMTLLEAFGRLENEVELWICGSGDCEEEIKAAAEKDKRIRFWGYVSSDEVEKLRNQATVLVNPRPNDGEYTKYSFPSKTMGYMASGKPVVMCKLDGIPDEYDQYLVYAKDSSVDALVEALNKVFAMSKMERERLGNGAKQFIAKSKNAVTQAQKIVKLINKIE